MLEYKAAILYHGTPRRSMPSIRLGALAREEDVHLAAEAECSNAKERRREAPAVVLRWTRGA